jgi:hypothetical protein
VAGAGDAVFAAEFAPEPATGNLVCSFLGTASFERLMTERATAPAGALSADGGDFAPRAGLAAPEDFIEAAALESPFAFEAPEALKDVADLTTPDAFTAAWTLFRACFAAFFVIFEALRAFLSSALARRTCCFASSAR